MGLLNEKWLYLVLICLRTIFYLSVNTEVQRYYFKKISIIPVVRMGLLNGKWLHLVLTFLCLIFPECL